MLPSNMLPDFRVRQRDYLLEISRLLTQELDLEKLLARILRVSIEMLAGQAGLIALKQPDGWRVTAAHGIAPAFLSYLTPLLAEEKVLIVQGTGFNWTHPDHFRLVFLPNSDDLTEAINRIARFLEGYRKRHQTA